MTWRSYSQLIRLPNVFTAAADSLAGWLLARGTFAEPEHWVPLCLASMLIYAGGIALNDWFDLEIDRLERPGRPLPSGQIPAGHAAGLGFGLMSLGLVLVGFAGVPSTRMVAGLLVAGVIAYDGLLKRTWLGPQMMGSCRALNLLLGLSFAPAFGGPVGWLAAGAYGVFVCGVTWISRSETVAGRSLGPVLGWVLQLVGLLGIIGSALQAGRFPASGTERPPIVPLEGLLILLVVSFVVNLATGNAVRTPRPELRQKAVKTGVLSLVWLDVGLVAAVRGPTTALAVAALWIPAFLLAKWFYST